MRLHTLALAVAGFFSLACSGLMEQVGLGDAIDVGGDDVGEGDAADDEAGAGGEEAAEEAEPAAPELDGAGTLDDPYDVDCGTRGDGIGGAESDVLYVECPAECTSGSIWGTGRYSPDSKICVAAVHVGAIKAADGGKVVVALLGAADNFVGTEANGISSSSWGGSYDLTFTVGPAADIPAPPPVERPARPARPGGRHR